MKETQPAVSCPALNGVEQRRRRELNDAMASTVRITIAILLLAALAGFSSATAQSVVPISEVNKLDRDSFRPRGEGAKVVGWAMHPYIYAGAMNVQPGDPNSPEAKGNLKLDSLVADFKGGKMLFSIRCWHDGPIQHFRQYEVEWRFSTEMSFLRPDQRFSVRTKMRCVNEGGCTPGNWTPWAGLGGEGQGVTVLGDVGMPHTNGLFFPSPREAFAWEYEGRLCAAPDRSERTEVEYPFVVTKNMEAWGMWDIHAFFSHTNIGALYLFKAVYEGDPLPTAGTVSATGSGGAGGGSPGSGGPTAGSGRTTTDVWGQVGGGSRSGSGQPGSGTAVSGQTSRDVWGPTGDRTQAGQAGIGAGSDRGTPAGATSGGQSGSGQTATPVTGSGTSSVTGAGDSTSPWGQSDPATDVTTMTLQAGARRVKIGESVTVPVWLIKGAELANLNFNVSYDAQVAKCAGPIARGSLVPSSMLFEANGAELGVARMGIASGQDLAGTGPIAQIPFQAVGKVGDRTVLRVEVTVTGSSNGARPGIATLNGEILVVGADGALPGDLNGNGVLDPSDAMEALKMSVRLIPENLVADMDKDGKVTSTDARLILQQVVGKK